MRLVAQVEADHGRVARVPPGQRDPVVHPGLAGVGAGVPEPVGLGRLPRLGPVVVQDDLEAGLPGVGDDLVEDLQRVQAAEVGVDRAGAVIEAEVLRHDRALGHLVRERDPDGVVAERLHSVHDGRVLLEVQSRGHPVRRLHAVPGDPGDAHGAIVCVQNRDARRVPEP